MKRLNYILMVTTIALLFNGCGEDSTSTNEEGNKTSPSSIPTNLTNTGVFGGLDIKLDRNPMIVKIKSLTVKSIDISLIGDAKEKYELDKEKKKEKYEELDSVGGYDADLSNKDDPVILENGRFYYVDTTFNISGVYPDGVNFQVVLVSEKDNSSINLINKTIELDEDGEQNIGADVLIPYDIDVSTYELVVYLIDSNLEDMSKSEKGIKDINEMGAIYVDIDYDEDRENVQLLNVKSTKYIDIPTQTKFKNGYSQDKSGSASLLFSNISETKQGITISAKMELSSGEKIDLYLLGSETTIGKIQKEVNYNIPAIAAPIKTPANMSKSLDLSVLSNPSTLNIDTEFNTGVEQTTGDRRHSINLTYYIPESKYTALIKRIPDLSKDTSSDGVDGKITWSIKIDNVQDTIPIVTMAPIIATKFIPTLSNLASPTVINVNEYTLKNPEISTVNPSSVVTPSVSTLTTTPTVSGIISNPVISGVTTNPTIAVHANNNIQALSVAKTPVYNGRIFDHIKDFERNDTPTEEEENRDAINQRNIQKADIFQSARKYTETSTGDRSIAALSFITDMGIQSRWYVPGVSAYAKADLDLHLFNHPVSLVSLNSEISASVRELHQTVIDVFEESEVQNLKYKTGMSLKLSTFGYTWYEEDDVKEDSVDISKVYSFEKRQHTIIEKNIFDRLKYDKTWIEEKTLFHTTFVIGPVPLEVTAGVKGSIEIHTGLDYEGIGVKLSATLPSKLNVYIEGGINIAVVRAGVRGDIHLIDTRLYGALTSGIRPSLTELNFYLNADADFTLKMILADFSVYAGTRTNIKWCRSWGVSYPCGLGWDNWSRSIYSTPWLYNRDWVLLDENLIDITIEL